MRNSKDTVVVTRMEMVENATDNFSRGGHSGAHSSGKEACFMQIVETKESVLGIGKRYIS